MTEMKLTCANCRKGFVPVPEDLKENPSGQGLLCESCLSDYIREDTNEILAQRVAKELRGSSESFRSVLSRVTEWDRLSTEDTEKVASRADQLYSEWVEENWK